MEDCNNQNCGSQGGQWKQGCLNRRDVENCNKYIPLKAQKEPVAEVPCSDGLSDVLELLEKDLKLSQRLIDDNKAKNDVEVVRIFQVKRGHTRDLVEQIKALGR